MSERLVFAKATVDLKNILNELSEFEQILRNKTDFQIQLGKEPFKKVIFKDENRNPEKEYLLNLIQTLKGIINLIFILPSNDLKEQIQKEARTIAYQLLKLKEPTSSIGGVYQSNPSLGMLIKFTPQPNSTILAEVSFTNDNGSLLAMSKIMAIQGKLAEALTPNDDIFNHIESLKNHIETKLQEFQRAKKGLEEFIKEESLGVFSKEFNKKAWWLWFQIVVFGSLTLFLILATLATILHLSEINSDNIHIFLIRSAIVFILGGISFYLLRYTIKLLERKDEYRYKALVLSTFPALNYFLNKDENRYELIKTIILEQQKLQTLSSEGEKTPINELVKLASIFKSEK